MTTEKEKKILWKGTIGEAVAQGRMTRKEADEMLLDRTDEEQDAYDEGFSAGKAEVIREEIDFLLGLADITSHISVDRLIAERVILLKSKIGELAK